MKTTLDCLPCLYKQALGTSRIASQAPALQKQIMDAVASLLPDLDMEISPPENAVAIYRLIAKLSECHDPYRKLKDQSNEFALSLKQKAHKTVQESPEPIIAAAKYAVAGNVIDYGTHHSFDAEEILNNCLNTPFANDDSRCFLEDLAGAERILYLADNCGELVFDGLLLEQLPTNTVVAVKESPIINDATMRDAACSDLPSSCRVISNGTDCPGTSLHQCSGEFQEAFSNADLIISKGQGNFETLSESTAPIYFLLTVKCHVVAEHIKECFDQQVKLGDMLFLKSQRTKK